MFRIGLCRFFLFRLFVWSLNFSAKAYGETAKECAEAYFYYGQSLLDLARMETGVLGNALQGGKCLEKSGLNKACRTGMSKNILFCVDICVCLNTKLRCEEM